MIEQQSFNWRHFESDIIILCVRWYLWYALSYRDLEGLMQERGLQVDHTTIYRWVQHYAPELEKRCRPHLKMTSDSWRVDETYRKIKGVWMYLYRAVDSQGKTLEFQLSPTRDAQAAQRFFAQALEASRTVAPRVITVNKNAAYPKAFRELKAAGRRITCFEQAVEEKRLQASRYQGKLSSTNASHSVMVGVQTGEEENEG